MVTSCVIGPQGGELALTDRYESISSVREGNTNQWRPEERKKGQGREEVSRASEGLTWSDRLAGTNAHTYTAFRAGCSAEHTQYTACFRTRGKREKTDKRGQITEKECVSDERAKRARLRTTGASQRMCFPGERETPTVALM